MLTKTLCWQAIEFLRPLKTTAPLEAVIRAVRRDVPALERDRFLAPDIEAASSILRNEIVWHEVQPYLQEFNTNMCEARKTGECTELRVASPTATVLRGRQKRGGVSESSGSSLMDSTSLASKYKKAK